jgi:minor extracellular serine protease Vpr
VADTILMNGAKPRLSSINPGLGLDFVHRQGAGMLDIPAALLSTLKVEPNKLSLGESESGPATHTLKIENSGNQPVTLTASHTPATAQPYQALPPTTGSFIPTALSAPATVTFSVPSVTVPAGGTASLTVTITPSESLADRAQYGGYIVLTPEDGNSVSVPYAGLKGDYQSIESLTPTAAAYPWLARQVGVDFVNQPSGGTFTLVGSDVPLILHHLEHPARRVRAEVFETSGRAWHLVYNVEYHSRNTLANSFWGFAFDGTTTNGRRQNVVPNGNYVVRLTVLKAGGDESNPAHVETWTSPVITIARP